MWSWFMPLMTADFRSTCFGSIIATGSLTATAEFRKQTFPLPVRASALPPRMQNSALLHDARKTILLLVVQSQPNCSTTSCAWIESWLNSSWTFAKNLIPEVNIQSQRRKKVTSGCPCLSVPATFPKAACFVQRCERWSRPLMKRRPPFELRP